MIVYGITGTFDGARLQFSGQGQAATQGVTLGNLTASATVSAQGNLEGDWQTDIGAAGTFTLLPQDLPQLAAEAANTAVQLYTVRHYFGPVEIDREQIIALADSVQRELSKSRVAVSVQAGTEQVRFLPDFKAEPATQGRAELIRVFAREPDVGGFNKVVTVEFGPHTNFVMVQGASEAWVLGQAERLKRDLRSVERGYVSKFFRSLGVGFNAALFFSALVFMPSLPDLWDRVKLMVAVLALKAYPSASGRTSEAGDSGLRHAQTEFAAR